MKQVIPRWLPVRWLLLALLAVLAGCTQGSVEQQEAIVNIETIRALTPSPTPTPSPTATATNTPVPPTPTAPPTPTPVPPTPTTNPALRGFSFCNQVAGRTDSGRFSARISNVRTETFPAFERIVLEFELAPESAPLAAVANCISARDYVEQNRAPAAPGDFVLQLDFPAWLQDELARSSFLSQTFTLTDTRIADTLDLHFAPASPAGATVLVALSEAAPYRISLDPDQPRLLIEIARAATLADEPDELRSAFGNDLPELAEPLYFLLNGDIWRLDNSGAISLTATIEQETDLAISPDGQQLAFCRNQEPGSDLAQQEALVSSALWLMQSDGSDARLLADVGINCADPVFSPDGQQVAFSVDELGQVPQQRSIWTVQIAPPTPTAVVAEAGIGSPITNTQQLTGTVTPTDPALSPFQRVAGDGEWSRSAPQWLGNDSSTLIYVARATDGRSTLLIGSTSNGSEQDVGAEVLAGSRYRSLAPPHVSPDGRIIAVEAARLDGSGTDLVLLDQQGTEQDVITGEFWHRFAGWGNDGSLVYLTTACESTLVQDYALQQRLSNGSERVLGTGVTDGGLGTMAVVRNGIAYVTSDQAVAGVRGPANAARQSQNDLWFWNLDTAERGVLFSAGRQISDLSRQPRP